MVIKRRTSRFSMSKAPEYKSNSVPSKVKPHSNEDWLPDDLGECLDRMFDPLDFSHLSIDEQLKKFKSRDLRVTKLFKTAQTVYGKVPVRKRCYYAEQLVDQQKATELDESLEHLRPITPTFAIKHSLAEPATPAKSSIAELEHNYHTRLNARMDQRNNLDTMGDVTKWVVNKPFADRTPLESSYLERLIAERRKRTEQTEDIIEAVPSFHVCFSFSFEVNFKLLYIMHGSSHSNTIIIYMYMYL